MYPYRYSIPGKDWQYFEAKDGQSAIAFACKQSGLNPKQIDLQTTIDGTTDQWVDCSHLQDDLRIPVVGPNGQLYPSFIDAANATGYHKNTISRWVKKGINGWRFAGADNVAAC